MIMAAAGMAAAVIGTLFHPDIHNYIYIAIGLILGSSIGIPMAMVPMTAMPQRTALSHAFGALAASMVGVAEYVIHGSSLGGVKVGALGLEVMLGSLTVTGSLIAAAKLQELMRGTPIQFKGQQVFNLAALSRDDWLIYHLDHQPCGFHVLLHHGRMRLCLWCHAGHPDRRRRYARGDVAVELLCRPVFGCDWICAGK